ncbi:MULTISPECIES: hypothetical protein [unclassified Mesorhizobium]|uniref:hypothetical protein n=1 Tax=unclassified Mesorhizobium TaxID=325217 RepID=UPI000FCB6FF6|nr:MULTISPECIES: hypothetical protein [unclassified Mesorhizobium]TGP26105.1 hypothetical protein EN875_034235 [Mesorhizobium sp. M2D.F.Ca.ET.232.01.1.1]TGQ24103.1 hypothetical protein EN863_063720 [Mesorhizobium sp. M00.F.Ca.ET.220.01.1.1]TGT95959.1 hypothetical protein EN806_53455 [bacterium M00.F.Ca.ET.163.01.1.1]
MDLTDILSSLFGGNAAQGNPYYAQQFSDHANPNAFQASLARFAPTQNASGLSQNPGMGTSSIQPQQPSIAPQAPQAQPQAQTAQASPAGSGIGDFFSALLMPHTAAKNRTAAYLQQQGMDAGTANLLVSDPQMLSAYLQQKMKTVGPTAFDQRADAAKQYGLDPSTPEGRNFILTGSIPGSQGGAGRFVNVGQGQLFDTQNQSFISAPNAQGGTNDDAKAIAGAIVNGDQPPDMKGLYKFSGPVRAELAKQGYNLTTAQEDWQATQRYLSSANGPQQLRLRQSVDFASEQLNQIDQLASQWDAGKFKVLNAANLAAAKNGLYGQDAASLATKLDAAITDLTADLGNVYMGGNSPTDHALELAGKNLSSSWSSATIHDMTKQIRQSLVYRQNSLRNATVAGMPAGTNPYDQNANAGAAPQAAAPQSGYQPGDAAATTPAGNRVIQQMTNPQPMGNGDGWQDLGNGVRVRKVN